MAYRVTAGHVTVDTGPDQVPTRIPRGELLPADVSQHQIDWELNLGTIEQVADESDGGAMPGGMSVSQTLQWVGSDRHRAQTALDAENAKASPRATLADRLETVLQVEGDDAGSDAGASVDS